MNCIEIEAIKVVETTSLGGTMNDIVDTLVRDTDRWTGQILGNRAGTPLLLYGQKDSRYLKGVAAKAKGFGLAVRWFDCPPPILPGVPYVVDQESFPCGDYPVTPVSRGFDLDCGDTPGMSCTAEAVSRIIKALAGEHPHVCIIGRGHAVKGLAEDLLRQDCTVTVCHSKTRNLQCASYYADIIVNSAPGAEFGYGVCGPGNLILDLGGGLSRWEHSSLVTYIGPRDIGRLNTSILLNRFAMSEKE